MIKKLSGILVLSVALIFSGVFQTSVDADSNSNDTQGYGYNIVHSVAGQWDQSSFNSLYKKIKQSLNDYGWEWEFDQSEQPETDQTEPEEPEQSEPEQTEQPEAEKPAPEAPSAPKPEQPAEPTPETPNQEEEQNEGEMDELNEFEQQVVELTNNERTQAGLAPLEADWELSQVARDKSQDMATGNYFDHNSPIYGSPFDMMQAYGIDYRTAGENIAQGQRTPQEVVNAWMNSPGHRDNIMNGNFTHIGIGFEESDSHWTQMFIGK